MNVGIAILNLNGELIYLNSFKEISKSKIIEVIIEHGNAVLIATDVEQIPKSVKKLASSLNSKIFSPNYDIQVSYKNNLVSEFLKKEKNRSFNKVNSKHNSHERDSLSAAIIAYKSYENKLKQLENKFLDYKDKVSQEFQKENSYFLEESNFELLNQAKTLLIHEIPISIAIETVLNRKIAENIINNSFITSMNDNVEVNETAENNEFNIKNSKTGENQTSFVKNQIANDSIDYEKVIRLEKFVKFQIKQVENQNKLIENLNYKNQHLTSQVNEKDSAIKNLKSKIKDLQRNQHIEILKNKEIASKIKLLKITQRKLIEEKKTREFLEDMLNKRISIDDFKNSKDLTPIKIIDSFSKKSISQISNSLELKKEDLVLLKSSKGGGTQTAKIFVDLGIKAILIYESLPQQSEEILEKNDIPIISIDNLDIEFFDNFAIAKTKKIESKISEWRNYQKNKAIKSAQSELLAVVDDYKAKRKRKK